MADVPGQRAGTEGAEGTAARAEELREAARAGRTERGLLGDIGGIIGLRKRRPLPGTGSGGRAVAGPEGVDPSDARLRHGPGSGSTRESGPGPGSGPGSGPEGVPHG